MIEIENVSNKDLIEGFRQTQGVKKISGWSTKRIIILIVIFAILLLGYNRWRELGYYHASPQSIHWHANLAIKIGGVWQVVPLGVGLQNQIEHPESLHTHTDDGKIHIEITGPVQARKIMLGRFFEMWDRKFDWHGARMFVNGVENYDYQNYVIRDGDKIEVDFK